MLYLLFFFSSEYLLFIWGRYNCSLNISSYILPVQKLCFSCNFAPTFSVKSLNEITPLRMALQPETRNYLQGTPASCLSLVIFLVSQQLDALMFPLWNQSVQNYIQISAIKRKAGVTPWYVVFALRPWQRAWNFCTWRKSSHCILNSIE